MISVNLIRTRNLIRTNMFTASVTSQGTSLHRVENNCQYVGRYFKELQNNCQHFGRYFKQLANNCPRFRTIFRTIIQIILGITGCSLSGASMQQVLKTYNTIPWPFKRNTTPLMEDSLSVTSESGEQLSRLSNLLFQFLFELAS